MNRHRTTARTTARTAARLVLVPVVALATVAGFGHDDAAATGFDLPIDIPLPDPAPGVPGLPGIDLPDLPQFPDPEVPTWPEIPMPDFPGLPGCWQVDLADLEVRITQTTPDDLQWRVEIEGSTFNLCDDTFIAQVRDTATGAVESTTFTVGDVIEANEGGDDYVATLATTCDWTTDLHLGEGHLLIGQWAGSKDCPDAPADDEPTVDSGEPVAPSEQATPAAEPGTEQTGGEQPGTDTTVPTPADGGQTSSGEQLPRTGASTTTLVAGGLLAMGLGLGALTIGIARRRQAI